MKMLEYDEWVVPGEVEYAEKKDAEIESQIENYHKASLRGDWMRNDWDIHIQITEHIVGKYGVTIPKYVWDYAINDIDIYNSMKLDWYRDMVAPIDGPEMFDLPADDIRSSLPEWDDSFFPESVRRDIVAMHSKRCRVALEIESMDGHYGHIQERFHLSGPKCGRVMRSFLDKLKNEDKAAAYTELEEELGDFIEPYDSYVTSCYYKPWYFPLDMTGDGIADAVREAYLNASKRSRRISPKEMNQIDFENLGRIFEIDRHPLGNYECLYQGRGGGLMIRFLFDYKDRKIAMAYPVYKGIQLFRESKEYQFYSKEGHYFTYGYFSGRHPLGWNGRK